MSSLEETHTQRNRVAHIPSEGRSTMMSYPSSSTVKPLSSQSQLIQVARARRDRVLLATVTMTTFLLWTAYFHQHFETMDDRQHVGEQNNKIRSRLLQSTERTLRFLTFGSASTWGQGLRNRQREAFPFLLSSEVDNYATPFGGAALPAVCTQSIVGNEAKYDVIVLEFSPQQVDDGLSVLSKRLRQRYPNATIVFVKLWSPSANLRYQLNETLQISADEWRRRSGSSLFRGRKPQKEALLTDPNKWSLEWSDAGALREVVFSVNGYMYSLPSPQPDKAIETLTNYIDLFQNDDWSQLSPLGHSLVAHGILNVVQRNVPPTLEQQTLGSWGSGDACALWQSTGLSSEHRTVLSSSQHVSKLSSPSTRRVHFGGHRHAVEVGSGIATLNVNNPFDEERMLYLTYMTALDSSSSSSSKVYPQTRISLGDKPSILVDPIYSGNDDRILQTEQQLLDPNHHRARTTPIGVIPPGETIIKLQAQETTLNRFRLTGASFLGSNDVHVEFALEPDVVHERSEGLKRFFTV